MKEKFVDFSVEKSYDREISFSEQVFEKPRNHYDLKLEENSKTTSATRYRVSVESGRHC
jgi:hypothetical protein